MAQHRITWRTAALALAALWCATAQQAAAALFQATGRITVVDTSYPHGGHTSDYILTADGGGLYTLVTSASTAAGGDLLAGLVSGGQVRVVAFQAPQIGAPWDIFGLEILSVPPPPMPPPPPPLGRPPPPSSLIGGRASVSAPISKRAASWASTWQPGVLLSESLPDPPRVVRDLPTLFILLDLCGKGGGTATTEASLSNMLFNGLTPMSDYIATCSYGKAQFDQSNSRVLTVKLPCNGTGHATKMAWGSSSCSNDNLFNWMYEVEWYIDNVLKPTSWNHRRYRHHVIITPRNMTGWAGPECDWSGMGSIGMAMGTWSYAWVSGDSWQQKQVYLHEMGHNYNLMHAATLNNGDPEACSHCDWSSAMGYCCDTRCMAAPHNAQLGWAKPLATVRASQLDEGNTLAYELPPQIMSDANYLQVTTDWLGAASVDAAGVASMGGPAFYNPANATFLLSYRLEFADFDEVSGGFEGGTNVYLFTVNNQYDKKDSVHVALLTAASPAWTDPSGTLVLRQVLANNDSAIVTVCRPEPGGEASLERCSDYSDNDCDGLIDADDPDCAPFYTLRSPPFAFPPPPLLSPPPPPPLRSPPPVRSPPPLRSPPPPRPPPPPPRSPADPALEDASPPPPPPPPPRSPPPSNGETASTTKKAKPPPPPANKKALKPPPPPPPPPASKSTVKPPPPPGKGKKGR